uniref:Uncharacterized protein n=1 Tax=Kalanchoe fedtschenkoi TaxID=63787 RepID=A0A7N0TLG0_KALFE
MAVLIVSIRILYNIHGFGVWENSLCNHERWFESNVSSQPGSECEQNDVYSSCGMGESPLNSKGSSMPDKDSRLDGGELLSNLQAIYEKLQNRYGLSNDDEKTITEEFWDIYHDKQEGNDEDGPNEDSITREPKYRDFETPHDVYSNDSKRAAYSDVGLTLSAHCESPHLDDQSEQSHGDDHNSPRRSEIPPSCAANEEQVASKISKDEAINRIKAEMEEHRFCYIPPRVNVKRHDYLHYVRKKDEGAYTYVAHADYYILLRACARVAQVDIRIMHVGVMNLERRLAWIEKRIDHCLNLRHPDVDDDHVDDYNGSVQQHECSEEVSFSE